MHYLYTLDIIKKRGCFFIYTKTFDPSQFSSIYPARERIYTGLKQGILSGSIPPDTYLTEVEISKLFSTSRTPVREALQRLTAEGILENIPRKGVLIKDVRTKDVLEHYDAAILLEPYAAQLAAQNRSAAQLGLLRDILDRRSGESSPEILNYQFHCAVAEASGNHVIRDYIVQTRDILRFLGSTRNLMPTSSPDYSHDKIYQAIADGDGELASSCMKNHLSMSKHSFVMCIGQNNNDRL